MTRPPYVPVRRVTDIRPGDHLCQIYETEEEHRSVITPFLHAGLERNEKVLYIADTRTEEVITDFLLSEGVDVDRFRQNGQFAVLTVADAYMKDGIFDPDRMIALLSEETDRACNEGYTALRVTGEMSWVLRGLPGSERLIEYENKLNTFFPGSRCLAICQYDRRLFDAGILIQVLVTHPYAVIGTNLIENFYFTNPDEFLHPGQAEKILDRRLACLAARKASEEALRESEEKFHTVADFTHDWELWLGQDKQMIYCSPSCERITGYIPDEFFAEPQILDRIVLPDDRALVEEHNRTAWETQSALSLDFRIVHRDGSVRWIGHVCQQVTDRDGTPLGRRISNRDITGQKLAYEALRESEEKFHQVFDGANDAVLLHTLTTDREPGRFIDANLVACRMLGYSRDELLTMGPLDVVPPEIHPQLSDIIRQAAIRDTFLIESRMRRKDGTTFPVESSIHLVNYEGKRVWISHIRDITDRKRGETELARMTRALRMLSNSTQALIHIEDETTLMNEICRIAIEVGGYRMAWIGFAEQDEAKTLRPVARAGFDSGYIESAHITWSGESERGRGPGGISIRTGQPSLARNIPLDPAFAPWRADAILRGYQSIIALPLTSEGRTFGTLGIYASEVDAFDHEEVEILKELAADLSFGITALRIRTRRELDEESIRNLNSYNRNLIEANLDPLVTIDHDGKISDANAAMEQVTGHSREELIGTDFSGYFTDRGRAKEGYLRVLANGIVRDYPLEILHKEGHTTSVLYNATVYRDEAGMVRGVFAAARDVTELIRAEEALRESENRFRQVAESTGQWIWEMDSDGLYTYTSPAVETMLGYMPDEIVGRLHFYDLFAPEMKEELKKKATDAFATKESFRGIVTTNLHKNGNRIILETSGVPNLDEEGRLIGYRGTDIDITARKRAEDALYMAHKKLNLLSSITRHDILNQLLILKSYLILSQSSKGDLQKMTELVKKGQHIAEIIEMQISFTREYQDLGVKAPVWQNMEASIGNSMGMLSMRDIRVITEVIDLEIYADPLFGKVCYNLIDNALRYGGPGMTTIRFSATESEQGLTIVCEDDGAGILAEDKARLFFRGYGKNTGLGLFLSREILAITSITITENGEPGKGARFEITVPKGAYRFTGSG